MTDTCDQCPNEVQTFRKVGMFYFQLCNAHAAEFDAEMEKRRLSKLKGLTYNSWT